MEHRDDRQHHITAGNIHGIRHQGGVSVQHRGPMAVQHSLRITCGTRGITERAGNLFIKVGPGKRIVLGG